MPGSEGLETVPLGARTVQLSTDGGTSWQQVHLIPGRNGSYTAIYTIPPLSQTNGYVSIKAQATNTTGDDITQEIDNAYGITAAGAAGSRGR